MHPDLDRPYRRLSKLPLRPVLAVAPALALALFATGCSPEPPAASKPLVAPSAPGKYAPQTRRSALVVPEPPAEIIDAGALVNEHNCLLCHGESGQSPGPSFTDIQGAYTRRKDLMLEVLAQKIIRGGAGNWGLVPMPANDRLRIEEARSVAKLILEAPTGQ